MYIYDNISLHSFLNEKFYRKYCTENQNTYFWSTIFFSKNCAVYEIWKNMVEQARPQMTIQHMHIARWLHESTPVLHLYVHCLLVYIYICINCS